MNLFLLKSNSHNPYTNLAIEELSSHMFENKQNSILLYLWVNEPSVIIGRNQNPNVECDLQRMKQDGVHAVRRKSGGGAVYHDLGNLNFSFITNDKIYSQENKQIICNAVNTFGFEAVSSGKNDLTIEQGKFSGFASFYDENRYIQHGTLMISVNLENLKKYLTPSVSKLQKHGICSVEQRVCNLSDYASNMTIQKMADSICEQFAKNYSNSMPTILAVEEFDATNVEKHSHAYRIV